MVPLATPIGLPGRDRRVPQLQVGRRRAQPLGRDGDRPGLDYISVKAPNESVQRNAQRSAPREGEGAPGEGRWLGAPGEGWWSAPADTAEPATRAPGAGPRSGPRRSALPVGAPRRNGHPRGGCPSAGNGEARERRPFLHFSVPGRRRSWRRRRRVHVPTQARGRRRRIPSMYVLSARCVGAGQYRPAPAAPCSDPQLIALSARSERLSRSLSSWARSAGRSPDGLRSQGSG
jgi:hypothetical protein